MHGSVLRTSAALVALCTLSTLAACSKSSDGTASKPSATSTNSSSASSDTAGGLPSGVVNASGVPTKVANVVALRKDVVISACKAVGNSWGASGTVSNSGTASHKYNVTVFFTTEHATVIGYGTALVDVAPGAKKEWSVVGKFHAAAPTYCVLRGVG